MIGKIFGNLKVLSIVENDSKGRKRIECECGCGSIRAYDFYKVKSGHTKSCGCLVSQGEELVSKILTKCGISYLSQYSFDQIQYLHLS